ncbi:DUF5107 domain-containing protein [Anaerocolumna xylanovorans]|uniref:DUF5107 domain-containing protein n=1 Tax=Anaerocolumna xylanovorans DSM 12503 TaxID=1121345 RepID=A0A1M7XXR5_9FIRM|nr:DUF5107 domain-containing protein [Anaerocolumna xylanovorans]SHO43758.1 hypothetical protein SAMN02745217_00346 [Anaerocolumna xylanovorans DSM 12503]
MNTQLQFTKVKMKISKLGSEASLPDIFWDMQEKSKVKSKLSEYEEIFEGYGSVNTAYPYRQYNTYNRQLHTEEVSAAVLENSFLKATFLPDYGGRLWSLIDKVTGRNLLYTNDVIRPSNLALRNAWFSGGVEWNIGIIGHNPFTMSPLFTAEFLDEEKGPILRFYEFERVRKVSYQMDFWLEENSKYLNCRMRISNQNDTVIPMYWWSNMAVPQYQGGRVVVPATWAYTCIDNVLQKVEVPNNCGYDLTQYENINNQIDYFFDIEDKDSKYIANIDQNGYGLLQMSTDRLKGRKLFCWGKNEGSDRWQEYLTEEAGRYVEIQAGLGKTQYGCIPMAPNTAWEWLEQYGPIQISSGGTQNFDAAKGEVNDYVSSLIGGQKLEKILLETRSLSKVKGRVMYQGSQNGVMENCVRKKQEIPPISPHLDFTTADERYSEWISFLEDGTLCCPAPDKKPMEYICDEFIYDKLKSEVKAKEANNWYAWLHIGFYSLYKENFQEAKAALSKSNQLQENAWAKYGLSITAIAECCYEEAITLLESGIKQNRTDLSYVKESYKVLNKLKAVKVMHELYLQLPAEIAAESRMVLNYIIALKGIGEYQRAYELLMNNGGLEVDDIKEGEDSIGSIWLELYSKLYPKENAFVPHKFHFRSF